MSKLIFFFTCSISCFGQLYVQGLPTQLPNSFIPDKSNSISFEADGKLIGSTIRLNWNNGCWEFSETNLTNKLPKTLFRLPSINSKQPPESGLWEELNQQGEVIGQRIVELKLNKSTSQATVQEAVILCPNGIILPRLTNEMILNMIKPKTGTMVWNINLDCVSIFDGNNWACL